MTQQMTPKAVKIRGQFLERIVREGFSIEKIEAAMADDRTRQLLNFMCQLAADNKETR